MSDRERPSSESLELEIARLREDLASVLESFSWRITRPLRRLRRSNRPAALSERLASDERGSIDPAVPDHPVPVRFPPGHYYSPLPDPAELIVEPRRSQVWPIHPRSTPGVEWRDDYQVALLSDVFARQRRLDLREEASDDPTEYFAQNGQYPPLDAWILEAMIQWWRPRPLSRSARDSRRSSPPA